VKVATYVYCIVKAASRPSTLRSPEGLPGASKPAALKVTPALWLITADVPLNVYAGDPLERSLSDLQWVGRIALAHEEVVEHFTLRRGLTVIPMKLFTMFSGPQRAIREISSRKTAIAGVMRRIAGAEEWGVRIVRGDAPAPGKASATRASSGTAFLAARKKARDDLRSARLLAAEAAADAFDHLERLARAAVRRDDAPPAGATPPLLDAALLVPKSERSRFETAAKREARACERAGARLTLTGPWPPYHFVGSGGSRQ
jgi:hypothetical protein